MGYDITLTTEKSLSVLALLGDDPTRTAVLDAVEAGNDWALDWLEGRAALTREKGTSVPARGWMVASFRHHTSRALDPFVHHHNVVPNTVVGPDGTRRALDARGLYAHAKAASALATARMRWQATTTLGLAWRPAAHGGWEVDGIDDATLSEFSTRRNEVDDAVAELEAAIGRGATPSEVERIVLKTRAAKRHVSVEDLRADWWSRARRHGHTPETLVTNARAENRPEVPPAEALYERLADLDDGLCQNVSVFSLGDVLGALCDIPLPQADGAPPQPLIVDAPDLVALADGFLASGHVVRLTRGGPTTPALFTTTAMLEVQRRIVARYRAGLRDRRAAYVPPHLVEAALADHPHLSAEQRRLVARFCTSGQRIQCAIGRAGAGKTTAMTAAVAAWTAAGYRVIGAAVKGEAARILGDSAGIPTETLAWYLAHPDPQTGPLDAGTVLVVDEASTISDRDLDHLAWHADQVGATLRLIGDPAQHGAVAAGGMFRVLCEAYPRRTPELKTTYRLQNPHDLAAANALRDGAIDAALGHLEVAGHLHIVEDESDFYRQALARWWNAHQAGDHHPMVDRRNAVRHTLNRLAHQLLRAQGAVGSDELHAPGNRRYSVGDTVIARKPARHLHPPDKADAYVRNGATGTVRAITRGTSPDDDTLTVDFDGIGRIALPRPYFDRHGAGTDDVGLDHAYAVTSWAVQGSTRATSTSRIDDNATRAEAYVDITRGRQSNYLYLTRAADPLDGETLPRLPPDPVDTTVATRLARSMGEVTAWELHQARRHDAQDSGISL